MTGKEFLEQAFIAHQEIEARLEEITRLQSLATRTTSTLKSTPSSSGAAKSKIEKAVAEMQEKENRLADEVAELMRITDKVSSAVEKIKNPVEKRILKYRYVSFFSWKQISLLMKMGKSNLFRLHADALENFSSHWSELD